MSTLDDVRRIASKLPGAVEGPIHFGFSVEVKGKAKGFLWVWNERIEPKKPKVPNPDVLAIVVGSLTAKEILSSDRPELYVDDPHYHSYPALLVKLKDVELEFLEDLIVEAWRAKAPKRLVAEYDSTESA